MNHKQKIKLARKLSGLQTGHFESYAWKTHTEEVARRVAQRQDHAKNNKNNS